MPTIDDETWEQYKQIPPNFDTSTDNGWVLYRNPTTKKATLLPKGCVGKTPNFENNPTFYDIAWYISPDGNKLWNAAHDMIQFDAPFADNTWHFSDDNEHLLNNGVGVANFEEPFSFASFRIENEGDKKLINNGVGIANFEEPFSYNNYRFEKNDIDEMEITIGIPLVSLGAFSNDNELSEINIHTNVKTLGEETFKHTKLEEVIISEDTTYNEKETFPKNTNIIKIIP